MNALERANTGLRARLNSDKANQLGNDVVSAGMEWATASAIGYAEGREGEKAQSAAPLIFGAALAGAVLARGPLRFASKNAAKAAGSIMFYKFGLSKGMDAAAAASTVTAI